MIANVSITDVYALARRNVFLAVTADSIELWEHRPLLLRRAVTLDRATLEAAIVLDRDPEHYNHDPDCALKITFDGGVSMFFDVRHRLDPGRLATYLSADIKRRHHRRERSPTIDEPNTPMFPTFYVEFDDHLEVVFFPHSIAYPRPKLSFVLLRPSKQTGAYLFRYNIHTPERGGKFYRADEAEDDQYGPELGERWLSALAFLNLDNTSATERLGTTQDKKDAWDYAKGSDVYAAIISQSSVIGYDLRAPQKSPAIQ